MKKCICRKWEKTTTNDGAARFGELKIKQAVQEIRSLKESVRGCKVDPRRGSNQGDPSDNRYFFHR